MRMQWIAALALATGLAGAPAAAEVDGTQPVLCSTIDIIECEPGGACQRLPHHEIGVPPFFAFDFDKKELTRRPREQNPLVSNFETLMNLENKLVLQGFERELEEDGEKLRDALGWTASIMKDSGQLVVSASGNEVGLVIFGACTSGS